MNQPILIVTRHSALVEFLREELGIEGEVIPHATAEQVRNRRVVGVLPLHLAALTESVTSVDLDVPAELRGKELTLQQLKDCYRGVMTYVIRDIYQFNDDVEHNCLSAMQGGMWLQLEPVRPYLAS